MNLKDKIKSYSFWVSIASAIILILKVLGSRFNFVVDESMVSDIFTAVCSILVLMGIIVVPSQQVDKNTQNKIEDNQSSNYTCQNLSIAKNIETINNLDNKLNETIISNNNIETTNVKLDEIQNIEEQTNHDNNLELNGKNYNDEINTEKNCEDNSSINNQSETSILEENNNSNSNLCNNEVDTNNNSITDKNSCNNISQNNSNLIVAFEKERNNFSNNLNEYLALLQQEIDNIKSKM